MPIPVTSDNCEVESQKVESSNKPLDQDVNDSPMDGSHSPHENEAFDLANDLENALQNNNQLTTNLDELDNLKFGSSKPVKDGSQLFRTQKMAGLAMLSQKATMQQLEEMGQDEKSSRLDDGEGTNLDDDQSHKSLGAGYKNFLQKFEGSTSLNKNGKTGLMMEEVGNGLGASPDSKLEAELDGILDSANFCKDSAR